MSSVSRKDFLRLSTLGIISSLLPIKEVEALSLILESPSKNTGNDFQLAVQIAKDAKELFYRKKYDEAESKYLECIRLAPAYIQFYDNLDNVYGAKGQFLKSVELYRVGLEKNSNLITFYDRAARALMRIELGHRTLAEEYKSQISTTSLLNDALLLYNDALSINPTAKFLLIAKEKLEHKIKIDAPNINFKTDVQHELDRQKRASEVRLQKEALSIMELEGLLDNIDKVKRTPLYFKHQIDLRDKHIKKEKKSLLSLILKKHIATFDKPNSIDTAIRLFEVDDEDGKSISLLKKILYQNNMFFEYVSYQRRYSNKKNDVFSNLGLSDAIETAFNKKQIASTDLQEARDKMEDMLLNWQLKPNLVIDIVNKLVKILLLQSDTSTAKLYTERTINIIDTKSSMHINKLVYTYSQVLYNSYNFVECEKVLLLAIYNIKDDESNAVLNKIQELLTNVEKDNLTSKLSLYYQLYYVYNYLNQPAKAVDILNQIIVLNPGDAFVSKRI